MLRRLVQVRAPMTMMTAVAAGIWGLRAYPVPADDPFLGMIELENPIALKLLIYGYATLWFTTPYFLASLATSLASILVYRRAPDARVRALPIYPADPGADAPLLVLGETHRITQPGPSPSPVWLTIPQRGLYTGIIVVGARDGKTRRACIRMPQLLRWKSHDADRKIGGLVLEVGDSAARCVRS